MGLSWNCVVGLGLMNWRQAIGSHWGFLLPLVYSRKRHWPTIDICVFEDLNVALRKGQSRVNCQRKRWRETSEVFLLLLLFLLRGLKWTRWGRLENVLQRRRGFFQETPSRHRAGAANQKQAECIWKISSLFDDSTYISNVHIYMIFTVKITLKCNLLGLIKASRSCHKRTIHSATWRLRTRVSLLYTSHESVTHYMKQEHKSTLLSYFFFLFWEERCKSSQAFPQLLQTSDNIIK